MTTHDEDQQLQRALIATRAIWMPDGPGLERWVQSFHRSKALDRKKRRHINYLAEQGLSAQNIVLWAKWMASDPDEQAQLCSVAIRKILANADRHSILTTRSPWPRIKVLKEQGHGRLRPQDWLIVLEHASINDWMFEDLAQHILQDNDKAHRVVLEVVLKNLTKPSSMRSSNNHYVEEYLWKDLSAKFIATHDDVMWQTLLMASAKAKQRQQGSEQDEDISLDEWMERDPRSVRLVVRHWSNPSHSVQPVQRPEKEILLLCKALEHPWPSDLLASVSDIKKNVKAQKTLMKVSERPAYSSLSTRSKLFQDIDIHLDRLELQSHITHEQHQASKRKM